MKERVPSVDLTRGLIMVLMTIDHARDFAQGAGIGDPMRIESVGMAMFVTRWLSHLCAPGFILLAGVSVALQVSRGLSPRAARTNLLIRGLVLVALELTVVNVAWTFNPFYPSKFLQVIWAIGWAMVFLGAIVTLRPAWIGIIGLIITAGHNLLDTFHFGSGTIGHVIWSILHEKNVLDTGLGFTLRTSYPILPVMGLSAVGYWLGNAYVLDEPKRRQRLFAGLGGACLALYSLLRLTNVYGDPYDFTTGPTAVQTVMSFLNPTKYPLSLQFMLMTVGLLLFVLASTERMRPASGHALMKLGRVPMFYYIAHLYLVRFIPLLLAVLTGTSLSSIDWFKRNYGIDFAWPLWGTYVLAAVTVFLLLPTLDPYARLRRAHGGLLRYL